MPAAAATRPAGTGRTPSRVPLDRVPPLVLSEVLRDVDLFVGVASVGNDPTWADGGPDGRHVDYWNRSASATSRPTARRARPCSSG